MAEKIKVRSKKKKNAFDYDLEGDYSRPRPVKDQDGVTISEFVAARLGKERVGWVVEWRPSWLEGLDSFRYFFYDAGLVVDAFDVGVSEISALGDVPGIEDQISRKHKLCSERGLIYVPVRPDDELDTVQLAAKLGVTKAKRMEAAT